MHGSMPVNKHGFSENELGALKELYVESGGYPTVLERRRLLVRFNLSRKKVYEWFQNRRCRERRKGKEDAVDC